MTDEETALTGVPTPRQRAAMRDDGRVSVPLALLRMIAETYGPKEQRDARTWCMTQLIAMLLENGHRASPIAEGAYRVGYSRIHDVFLDDPVAAGFAPADGRGTLAASVSAMAAEVGELRRALFMAVEAFRRLEEDIGRVTADNREAGARILSTEFADVAARADVSGDAVELAEEEEAEPVQEFAA